MKKANVKPWGYELLAYQNDDVAIWHLFIDPWQETSLHSHPNKKTGLIVLDGGAEVCFMSGKEKLFASEKCMIRQGVFHKTRNRTNQVLQLLEIETPVNKDDIVRLNDKYGRSVQFFKEPIRDIDVRYPWENKERRMYHSKPIGSCFVKLTKFEECLSLKKPLLSVDCNYMFVAGGVKANNRYVCSPGDIISGGNLTTLVDEFGLEENSQAIKVWNEK
jgi:mannose-6-phosphate isomerase-like protein (cupin superfamily)